MACPSSPAYTMGARFGSNTKALSPGPATYYQRDTNAYKNKSAAWSMGARFAGSGRGARSPGPAAYPPHLYNVKKNPYAYSFGTKHGMHTCPMIIPEDTMDCL